MSEFWLDAVAITCVVVAIPTLGLYLGYRETHVRNPSDMTQRQRDRWRAAAPRWLRWLL